MKKFSEIMFYLLFGSLVILGILFFCLTLKTGIELLIG